MTERHIQFLRNTTTPIYASKAEAVAALRDAASAPVNTLNDGEPILGRYAAKAYAYDTDNSVWKEVDYNSETTYVILPSSPAKIGGEGTGTWDTSKSYLVIRSVMGIVKFDGTNRSISIFEDMDEIDNILDSLDYAQTVNSNFIVTAVHQTNGLISDERAQLMTDGSISITHDIEHEQITLEVVIENGERLIAKNTNGELYTDLDLHKLTDAEVSQLDDPNVKEAFMLKDTFGTQIGDTIKIYKDSSLYDVYSGTMADTIENMTSWKAVEGMTGVNPVYTTYVNPATSTSGLTVYDTKGTGANKDTYTASSSLTGYTGSFDASTNILTISDGTGTYTYLYDGYATPFVHKHTYVDVTETTINTNATALASNWLMNEAHTEVITPTTNGMYHVNTDSESQYYNKYYTWNGTTYVVATDPANDAKRAMVFVYQLENDSYEIIKLSLEDFLTNYIFGDGLVYNAGTKTVAVRPGYGIVFDENRAVTLSTNITAGLDYYATCTSASTASALEATLVNNGTVYELVPGANVVVTFTNASTAASPLTLSVAGTTAKTLTYNGSNMTSDMIQAGSTLHFVYDGTNYRLVGISDNGTNGLEYVTNTHTANTAHDHGNGLDIVDSYTKVYIVSGSTPYSDGWLSTSDGGAALTPAVDTQYRVFSSGNYYGRTYEWNGTRYVITTGVSQDIAVKVASTMVDASDGTTHLNNVDNLITITSNGLTLKNAWDCGSY